MLQVRLNDLKQKKNIRNGLIEFKSIMMVSGLHGMKVMDLKVYIKKENL